MIGNGRVLRKFVHKEQAEDRKLKNYRALSTLPGLLHHSKTDYGTALHDH